MNKALLLIVMIVIVHSAYAGDETSDRLEEVHRQYQITKQDRSEERVKLLIELDQELRTLIDKAWTVQNKSIDQKYWKEKYLDIGVGVGHYSEALGYSGKLLIEAKALDVNSKHASYTRYTDICGGGGSFSGECDRPDIAVALAYEKEFPNAPFIWDTLVTIGNFYSDLREALKENESKDYKYECYSKYINKKPITDQLESARLLAVKFYKKALAVHSDNKAANDSIHEWMRTLESGGDDIGWHFCSD